MYLHRCHLARSLQAGLEQDLDLTSGARGEFPGACRLAMLPAVARIIRLCFDRYRATNLGE